MLAGAGRPAPAAFLAGSLIHPNTPFLDCFQDLIRDPQVPFPNPKLNLRLIVPMEIRPPAYHQPKILCQLPEVRSEERRVGKECM